MGMEMKPVQHKRTRVIWKEMDQDEEGPDSGSGSSSGSSAGFVLEAFGSVERVDIDRAW